MTGNVGGSGLCCKASVNFEVIFPVLLLFSQVFFALTQILCHVVVQNSVIGVTVADNPKSIFDIHLSVSYRSNQLFPLARVVKALSYK